MQLNSHKTHVITYSRKTNVLCYDYRLCRSAITCTTSIKDLGVFFDSKLYFHNHVDFLFSECIKILGLIRSITFRFSCLDCLFSLYTALVRPRLEYATVVWNSITSMVFKKLECIQQKFASVCFYHFFPNLPYNYVLASNKLNLPSLSMRRQHLDAFFFFFPYRPIVAWNPALPSSRYICGRTRLSWSYPAGLCLTLCRGNVLHVNNMNLINSLNCSSSSCSCMW
jgi:hypothetical protein